MRATSSVLKALCGCAVALVLLMVFVVIGKFYHFKPEGDPWYE